MTLFDAFALKKTYDTSYSINKERIMNNNNDYVSGLNSGIYKEADLSRFNNFSEEPISQRYTINDNDIELFSDEDKVGYVIKNGNEILEANFAENETDLNEIINSRTLGLISIINGHTESAEKLSGEENELIDEYNQFKESSRIFSVSAVSNAGLPENYDIIMSYDISTGEYSASITKDGKIIDTVDQSDLANGRTFDEAVADSMSEISNESSVPLQLTPDEIKKRRDDFAYAIGEIMEEMDKVKANQETEKESKSLEKEYDTNEVPKCSQCHSIRHEPTNLLPIEIEGDKGDKYNKPAETSNNNNNQEKGKEVIKDETAELDDDSPVLTLKVHS